MVGKVRRGREYSYERALHLSNALARDVLLELGRGSRDLEDELAMRGLVVELAAECPELDPVAAGRPLAHCTVSRSSPRTPRQALPL